MILKSWDVRYYTLDDGRSLCLECMETAIIDTGECQPLYHAIRDYYEGMNMKLDQQIPMLLVQREALNDAIVGEKNVSSDIWLIHNCFCDSFSQDTIRVNPRYVCFTGISSHAWDKRFMLVRRTNSYKCKSFQTLLGNLLKFLILNSNFIFLCFFFGSSQVLRRPRLGAHRLVGMRTQPQKLTRKCEVTAILVLYGLPRYYTTLLTQLSN